MLNDALWVETDSKALSESPSTDVVGMCSELPLGLVADSPQGMINRKSRRSLSRVPRWRLAREGPFLAERSSSSLSSFGAGCAFRNTTYRASDYASPSGEFGIPLNHPRFLEWVGVPESAGLLEMGPGRWLNALSRDQAMDAAMVTSGCLLDGHEIGCSGSVCPLTAGHSVKDAAGGPRFQ